MTGFEMPVQGTRPKFLFPRTEQTRSKKSYSLWGGGVSPELPAVWPELSAFLSPFASEEDLYSPFFPP